MSKTLREFQDGDVIFAQGDAATAAFTLLEGNVELVQNGEAGPVTLAFIQAGETFGDMSLIEGKPHQATARAVGTASVEEISRDEYLGNVTKSPSSALGLIQSLIGRLRSMNARLTAPSTAQPTPGVVVPGVLSRWFGGGNRLNVRIASIVGAEPSVSRQVAQLLARRPGVGAKLIRTTIDARALAAEADEHAPVELVEPTPQEKAARHLSATQDAARAALLKAGGDVLIWGALPEPGATLTLYLTTAKPEDEDKAGLFANVLPVKIPATVTPEWGDLLYAAVLAVANPKDKTVREQCQQFLPRAMDAARDFITNLGFDLTTDEQNSARLTFANVVAQTAALHNSGHLFAHAVDLYTTALNAISKEATPLLWALVQRNTGVALHGLADAGGDEMNAEATTPEDALDRATTAYRAADQILSKSVLPLIWAAMQTRLGMALYKLDAKTQDTEMLKHTLSAYQSALQVFSPQQSPLKWAEVMHNLAQAAQVLGGQIRSDELFNKAVDACNAALRIRKQDKFPFLWAATQNNLGSALFLLGRSTQDGEILAKAALSFAQVRDFHSGLGNANAAAIAERNLGHVEKVLNALEESQKKSQSNKPPRMKWEPPEDPVDTPAESEEAAPPPPDEKKPAD